MSAAPRRPSDPSRPAAPKSKASAAAAKPAAGAESAKSTPAKAGASAKSAAAKKPPKTAASAKPVKSPRSSKPSNPAEHDARAARAGWLSGIRFSGFSLIMIGVLVLAVVVLAPTIASFAEQRRHIAELRAAVSAQEAGLQDLRDQRERWNDDTYIITQARERLSYVLPGEVSYLVIDDRTEAAKAESGAAVSAEVTETKGDWMRTLLTSVMTAGLAPDAAGAGR
ncbi:septum formation initiator family protein [Agromyces sp. CFH 90414]|uniref:Septum formation initiator family protein n=1 Tax=Agromyces agglutinans TaxID=2662258 RepID=A0A6I2F8G1_9MICO|nr:septum formation initiator family protein [Agromyces agglutinans]MRG60899.1 septum formation initiator family protein [Agromyces agglutinans]